MVTEQKTLERLVIANGKILDSKGKQVKAKPVSELDLVSINAITEEIDKEIIKEAPINADSYMLSKHSFTTRVGYPNLCQESKALPQFSLYGLQYWRKE